MKSRIRFSMFLATALLAGADAFAGGVVVTPTEASLRAALEGGGAITFDCDGTITLAASLVITNLTSIDARNRAIVISGGGATRPFTVLPGATLELRNLTVADGFARGADGISGQEWPDANGEPGFGGGLWIEGAELVSSNCVFLRNEAVGGRGGTGGLAPPPGTGGFAFGGAISSSNSHVTLVDCQFAFNRAVGGEGGIGGNYASGGDSRGGAVYASGGLIRLLRTHIRTNTALAGRGHFLSAIRYSGSALGGGVRMETGLLEMNGVVLADNRANVEFGHSGTAEGGGCSIGGGSAAILNSLFDENRASGGEGLGHGTPFGMPGGNAFGGGLSVTTGSSWITNCAFVGNLASGGPQMMGGSPGYAYGGGLYNAASMVVCNATFGHNAAHAGSSGTWALHSGAHGGGLYNRGTLSLDSVTVCLNALLASSSEVYITPQSFGGGVYTTNGETRVINSIFANHAVGSNAFGVLVDLGNNLSSDLSCAFTNSTSVNSADPRLSPLAYYGSPTPVFALLEGSPAIDAGANKPSPATDQRGRARPFGAATDIGAFESSPPYFIRGEISGRTLSTQVEVGAEGAPPVQTAGGVFVLGALGAGEFDVTPQSPNYLFVPASRTISVGPDRIGVDFKAYRWNALSFEEVTNGALHALYAGTNGTLIQIQTSSDLKAWSGVATNEVGPGNLLELHLPIGSDSKRFYRGVQ